MVSIVLAGGGTAGHTSPLIATAKALDAMADVRLLAIGTAKGLETTVIPAAGLELALIDPVPLPRSLNLDLVKLPVTLSSAVLQARKVLKDAKADVLVGFGGYVSIPANLAARSMKVPVVVHEANKLPGIANKVGARVATRVAVSFPDTKLRKAEYVGLPIRQMISTLDRAALQREAREFFGLDPDRPTLVVTGGSQGARRLNRSVSGAAAALAAGGVQVLHVVGPNGEATPAPNNAGVPYVVLNFVDRMDYALAAADLMICRSGASSVTEAAATGTPTIFVPLPIGNGEQALNAKPVVDAGGALLVDDAALTVDYVAATVPALAADTDRLAAMSRAAAGLIPRDADDKLARIIAEVSR